jgi:hypothetical protein
MPSAGAICNHSLFALPAFLLACLLERDQQCSKQGGGIHIVLYTVGTDYTTYGPPRSPLVAYGESDHQKYGYLINLREDDF